MINTIIKEFPKIPIIIGGQAFSRGGLEVIEKYDNVTYLKDLDSIDSLLKTKL